jgi:hypothetical protein
MRRFRFKPLCVCAGLPLLAALAVLQICGCGAGISTGVPSSTGTMNSSKQAPVSAPLLGFAWDSTAQVLRGVSGVAGAAKLDTLAGTGSGFSTALAAGSHDYALLLDVKGALYLATLPGGTPQQLSAGPWSGMATSASGAYAVVYGAAGTMPQLITGLPLQPALHSIDAQGLSIAGASVSDGGAALLAGNASGGSVVILAVAQGGTASRALTIGALGGMAFVPGSDRALVADAAIGTVTQIANVSSAPAPSVVSGAKIAQPVGLDVSADGKWGLVANSSGTVMRLDMSGQSAPVVTKCSCTPTTVANLSGTAFLLTGAGSSTAWMIDASGTPRLLFIPALPTQKVAGGGQ